MFQFIKKFIKRSLPSGRFNPIPAGEYNIIAPFPEKGSWYNEKGESLKELFKRRDRMFMKHIQDSYPEITEKDYLDIGVDTIDEKRYRLTAEIPEDRIGVVIDSREKMRHIILYRIVG